jgi:hypothetical protein
MAGQHVQGLVAECHRIIMDEAGDEHHPANSGGGGGGGGVGAVEAFDKWWRQLRETERVAALSLGWDERLWDGGKRVRAGHSRWDDLGPRRREACETLGYTAQSWQATWGTSTSEWS